MHNDDLLRLARIVADACGSERSAEALRKDADRLVRDLEAAPTVQAPRTITREELEYALEILLTSKNGYDSDLRDIAAAWRLTVEG